MILILIALASAWGRHPESWKWIDVFGTYAVAGARLSDPEAAVSIIICFALALTLFMTR